MSVVTRVRAFPVILKTAVLFLPWVLAAATYAAVARSFERAPLIHVRWAAAVDDRTRTELQQRFALTGAQHDSGRTWFYFLTAPNTSNIRALVTSSAVEDTHHLDRLAFRVSAAAERRGPYISDGSVPRWLPNALLELAIGLLVAAAWAAGGAIAPTVARVVARRDQFAQTLRQPVTLALIVMGTGLLLIWIRYIAHLRVGAYESLPFRVGDWLVSYETGFVRRGLPGSPILALTTLLGVQPNQIVLWLQTALYTLLSCLLMMLARGKRLNIWFLAFLFSPAGLLFPLYDPAVAGRKDVVFFVVFALYAWWLPRPERRWARAATFALGALTTLTHELFFFFTPYFFLMRLLQSDDAITPRRFTSELSLFAGSLLALVLALTAGADLHGEAQCAALLRRGFNAGLCDGVLRYPITTVGDGVRTVTEAMRSLGYLRVYPVALLLAALPLAPLIGQMHRRPRWLLPGMAAAFGFTLPMFAIALDWGRLINIHVMALAVVIMALVLEDRSAPGTVLGTRNRWLRIVTLAAIFGYLSAWSIRHCCENAFNAGVFG